MSVTQKPARQNSVCKLSKQKAFLGRGSSRKKFAFTRCLKCSFPSCKPTREHLTGPRFSLQRDMTLNFRKSPATDGRPPQTLDIDIMKPVCGRFSKMLGTTYLPTNSFSQSDYSNIVGKKCWLNLTFMDVPVGPTLNCIAQKKHMLSGNIAELFISTSSHCKRYCCDIHICSVLLFVPICSGGEITVVTVSHMLSASSLRKIPVQRIHTWWHTGKNNKNVKQADY